MITIAHDSIKYFHGDHVVKYITIVNRNREENMDGIEWRGSGLVE